MQTTGNFVAVGIEFAAGMQFGHHHLRGRDAFFEVDVHGNTAAIVDYRYRVVNVNSAVDLVAMTSQGFIDGIVHNLINQVVETSLAGGADVHGWPLPNGLQAFKNFD